MTRGGAALLLGSLVFVAALGHAAAALPALPATHFDARGRADGWMSKAAFLATLGLTGAGTSGLLALIAQWLPKLPDEILNMPHKAYWLAPERRHESLCTLRSMLLAIGAVTMLLLAFVVWSTVDANGSEGPPRLPASIDAVLIGYFVVLTLQVGTLLWHFGRQPR